MARIRDPQGTAALATLFGETEVAAVKEPPVEEYEPLIGVDFSRVIDNTHFRDEEQPAWKAVLEHVASVNAQALAAAARPASYPQLTSQPSAYRGHPVRLMGTVRRIEVVVPSESVWPAGTLHRVTLVPDGGPLTFVVYCIQPPPSTRLAPPYPRIQVSGLFYKNWSYDFNDDLLVAPVLVAQQINWPVAQTLGVMEPTVSPWVALGLGGAAASVAIYWLRRQDARLRRLTRPRPAFDPTAFAQSPADDAKGNGEAQ